MNIKFLIIGLILTLMMVGIVSADNLTPPPGVRIAGYISSHAQVGIWWMPPTDVDYKSTHIWFDNVYIGEQLSPIKFYNAGSVVGLPPGSYIFSTKTEDTFGNVNNTWVNQTVIVGIYTDPYYNATYVGSNGNCINVTVGNYSFILEGVKYKYIDQGDFECVYHETVDVCIEEWFCDDWCVTPTPTPTPTPIPRQASDIYNDIPSYIYVAILLIVAISVIAVIFRLLGGGESE